jgi:hypothetical protein
MTGGEQLLKMGPKVDSKMKRLNQNQPKIDQILSTPLRLQSMRCEALGKGYIH